MPADKGQPGAGVPPTDPSGYEGMAQGPHGAPQGFQGAARGEAMTPGEGIARSDMGQMDPHVAELMAFIKNALAAIMGGGMHQ